MGSTPRRVVAAVWNFVGFPLRAFILPERWQRSIRLTPLRDERLQRVASFARGRTLDVACGDNALVHTRLRSSGMPSVGLDRVAQGADVVGDARHLPFKDGQFGTVTMVAALNHIPRSERFEALHETWRVLHPGGRLVVTMIGRVVGWLCHLLTWWDPRPMQDRAHEDPGLGHSQVIRFAASAGFSLVRRDRFLYGLNSVFLFERAEAR